MESRLRSESGVAKGLCAVIGEDSYRLPHRTATRDCKLISRERFASRKLAAEFPIGIVNSFVMERPWVIRTQLSAPSICFAQSSLTLSPRYVHTRHIILEIGQRGPFPRLISPRLDLSPRLATTIPFRERLSSARRDTRDDRMCRSVYRIVVFASDLNRRTHSRSR